MTTPAPQKLAQPAEVAAWLQIPEERLKKMRQRGEGPAYIKIGRSIRYAWLDVHKWADAQRAQSAGSDDE